MDFLAKLMKNRIDLHNHVRTRSEMHEGDLIRVLARARESLGIGGIVGVTNFEDNRYEQLLSQAAQEDFSIGPANSSIHSPEYGITIVKTQEVPTAQGHLLVVGLGEGKELEGGEHLADTLEKAKDLGCLTIAVHIFAPYGLGKFLSDRTHYLKSLDALEVSNGEAGIFIGANEHARHFFNVVSHINPLLGAVSFSDGHSIGKIGSSYTEIDRVSYSSPVFGDLAKEIRGVRDFANLKLSPSYFGAVRHIAELTSAGLSAFFNPDSKT